MRNLIITMLLTILGFSSFGQKYNMNFKVSDKTKVESIKKKIKNSSIEIKQCYPNAKTKELQLYYCIVGQNDKSSIAKILNEEKISYIKDEEECYALTAFTNDKWLVNGWCNNYALEMVDAENAWKISKGRPDIRIGIADSDFETTHEDLKNQIVSVKGPVSAKYWHGTSVAGVAAAETNNGKGVAGIGYKSKLVCQRINHYIINDRCYSDSGNIRESVWNLYQTGVPIINVSWSSTGLNKTAAEEITKYGTTIVVSAGNNPCDQNHFEIADVPGVIVVSSVNSDNMHGPTGHAHNEHVDLCAPGINVSSTKEGDEPYGGVWGTSFAAPIVSGIIALMLDVNPNLEPAKIELILKETADPVADAANFPNGVGAGRVNAYKAVKAAGTRTYTNTTFGNRNLSAGYGFNLKNVKIGANSNVKLTARCEVNIEGTFEVPLGSEFTISIDKNAQTN